MHCGGVDQAPYRVESLGRMTNADIGLRFHDLVNKKFDFLSPLRIIDRGLTGRACKLISPDSEFGPMFSNDLLAVTDE